MTHYNATFLHNDRLSWQYHGRKQLNGLQASREGQPLMEVDISEEKGVEIVS